MSNKIQSTSPILPTVANGSSLRWDHSGTSRLSDQSVLDSINIDNFEMIRLQLEKKNDENAPVLSPPIADSVPGSISNTASPHSISATLDPAVAPVVFDTAMFGNFGDDLTWDEADVQAVMDLNAVNDAMDELINGVIRRSSSVDNDTSAESSTTADDVIDTMKRVDARDGHRIEKKNSYDSVNSDKNWSRRTSPETVVPFVESDMDIEGFKSWQSSHRWSTVTIKHLLEALQQYVYK